MCENKAKRAALKVYNVFHVQHIGNHGLKDQLHSRHTSSGLKARAWTPCGGQMLSSPCVWTEHFLPFYKSQCNGERGLPKINTPPSFLLHSLRLENWFLMLRLRGPWFSFRRGCCVTFGFRQDTQVHHEHRGDVILLSENTHLLSVMHRQNTLLLKPDRWGLETCRGRSKYSLHTRHHGYTSGGKPM